MTDGQHPAEAEFVETVQGEVVDPDLDAELVDDPSVTDELVAIDGELASGDEDVMVLDTWQIQLPATGDENVDAALAQLTDVEGLPPAQHADVYEAVHAGLQDALADLDRT